MTEWRNKDFHEPSVQQEFMSDTQARLSEKWAWRHDMGYERVFDVIDFTETDKAGFDIVAIGGGLAFSPKKPGQCPMVHQITGSRITAAFYQYGGSLGWDKQYFDDGDWHAIDGAADRFCKRWYRERSQAFYDLISASRPDNDIPLQPEGVIATLNYAASDIISSHASYGYDVNPMTKFVVVGSPGVLADIHKCTFERDAQFNFEMAETLRLKNCDLSAETDQVFVCLPGRKAKGGYRQPLSLVPCTNNIANYSEVVAAYGRYGGVVGNTDQFRRCVILP